MNIIQTAPVTAASCGPVYAALTIQNAEIAENARPGQFLHIRCGENQLRRPISIAGVDGTLVELVFERKGRGTNFLAACRPGDTLDVLGPLGHGFPDIAGRVLLVGGGVGVPPMRFAAQRAEKADAVLAFRSKDRALLIPEMTELLGRVTVMSDDGSIGTRGFAADGVQKMLAGGDYRAVFACGPKIMLKTTFDVCRAANVPCYVSMEERMGCGLGACLTCAVPIHAEGGVVMKKACKDGPVFLAEEVAWNG